MGWWEILSKYARRWFTRKKKSAQGPATHAYAIE